MGLRFRRSIRIMPGIRVNLSLRGTSISVGGRGATYNLSRRGSRVTLGLPGTGLSYTHTVSRQNPIAALSSSIPQRRRYSATPLVIATFLLGLFYLATHPTGTPQTSSFRVPQAQANDVADITGALGQASQGDPAAMDQPILDRAIPLPRPRPKLQSDVVGPPLQLVPQQ
jgi:Protein of unknown function (DUF4236)